MIDHSQVHPILLMHTHCKLYCFVSAKIINAPYYQRKMEQMRSPIHKKVLCGINSTKLEIKN
jgi:hypothetical protein